MRIKDLLIKKGMSAKELASICELSEMGLSKIMTGKSHPNSTTIIKIADALGVKCGELFDDYEPAQENNPSSFTCPHCGKPISIEIKPSE